MAALEALSIAVAKGAFVPWHPLKVKTLGDWDQHPTWTSQGPAGRIMGLVGQTRAPQDRIRALWDGSGPAGPTWTPQDESGHRDGSGPEG